jgi:NTE family protein
VTADLATEPGTSPLPGRERALVLGGGGSAGNAWEIGVIAGLFDAGLDVTEADLIIGTSAGSTAAAQITSATQPTELLADILAGAPQPRTGPVGSDGGRVPNVPVADLLEKTSGIIRAAENAADMRRRMGAAALEMAVASDSSAQTRRRAIVAARLPSQRWPQRQSRNHLPGQQLSRHIRLRRQSDGSVDASVRRSSRLPPRRSPRRAAHRILALTPRNQSTR